MQTDYPRRYNMDTWISTQGRVLTNKILTNEIIIIKDKNKLSLQSDILRSRRSKS